MTLAGARELPGLGYLHPPGVFTIILAQLVMVVWRGGACASYEACTCAVDHSYILPVQAVLMSVLVYRERQCWLDLLKCLGACCVLAVVEMFRRQLHVLLALPLILLVVYAQVCISLYMYHRFIFHAHWTARTRGFDRWLWEMVRANYVMHYFEHHQVSRTPQDVEKLAKLQKVSLTQEEIQAKYKEDWLLQNFVNYTDRGITIEGPIGLLGAFMFFSILPAGAVSILSYRAGDILGTALHVVGTACGMYQTMVQHDKYHCDDETLDVYASTSWYGWFWRSAEMRRIIHEHKLHHDGKNHSRYFSMIPFDCFFIYPLWPEEHMRPTIEATVAAARHWLCSAVGSTYREGLERCEAHGRTLSVLVLLAFHAGLAYSSWVLFASDILMNLVFIGYVYRIWCTSMGADNSKFVRTDPRCASFKPRPAVTGAELGDVCESASKTLLGRLRSRSGADHGLRFAGPKQPKVQELQELTMPRGESDEAKCGKSTKAGALDMSHIHVSFIPFLAAHYLLVPNAIFLWLSASMKLVIRERLQRANWLHVAPCEYTSVVAELCLEGMESINFKRISTEAGEPIAEFRWDNIAFIRMDTTVGTVSCFRILVNLSSRRMVGATIDGKAASAKKALILLWFNTVFGTHVKIHAMANWGIAEHVECLQTWWMQQCTIMYNYFGFVVFSRAITEFWYKVGLTLRCYSNVREASAHSASAGVPFHGQVRELREHSRLVRFLLKVRKVFLAEFERHRSDFEGADAEAMFVGTICHSLDHCMMDRNLRDPLWLDVEDPEFGAMAELMRHVRVGFVPDLPCLTFNQRYKQMNHPFYRKVYAYARSVDPWFADRMDAGIVK